MDTSPIQLDATRPDSFDRVQVFVRLLIVSVLSSLGVQGWPFGIFYLALPLLAAVLLTGKDSERFIADDAPRIARALDWLFSVFAYLTLVVDRLPLGAERPLRVQITASGKPNPVAALLRLITSIPSALVLVLWGVLASFGVLIAAVCVLVSNQYPKWLWEFQLAVLRWQARLFAYHASLVETYPPFALDTSHGEPMQPSGALPIEP
jgi:hypothetical protein